jgi:hypothetical protein
VTQTFPQQAPAQHKARAIFGKPELRRSFAVPVIQTRFQKSQRVARLGNVRDPYDHMSGKVFAAVRLHRFQFSHKRTQRTQKRTEEEPAFLLNLFVFSAFFCGY